MLFEREEEIKATAQQLCASYDTQRIKEPSLDLGRFFEDSRSKQPWGNDTDFCNAIYHALTRLVDQAEPIDKLTRDKEANRRKIEEKANEFINEFIESKIIKLKAKNVKEAEGEWRLLYAPEAKQKKRNWWTINPLVDKVYEIPLSLKQIQQRDRGEKEEFAQSLVDTIQVLIRENPEHKDNLLKIIESGVIYSCDKEKDFEGKSFYVQIDTGLWKEKEYFWKWLHGNLKKFLSRKGAGFLENNEIVGMADEVCLKILKQPLRLPFVKPFLYTVVQNKLTDLNREKSTQKRGGQKPSEICEELKSLPKEIKKFPQLSYGNEMDYDPEEGRLVFNGRVMTEQDRTKLEYLSTDTTYRKAIEELYYRTQLSKKENGNRQKEDLNYEGQSFDDIDDAEFLFDNPQTDRGREDAYKQKVAGEIENLEEDDISELGDKPIEEEELDEEGEEFSNHHSDEAPTSTKKILLLLKLPNVRKKPRLVRILKLVKDGEDNVVKKVADEFGKDDSTIYRDFEKLDEIAKTLKEEDLK